MSHGWPPFVKPMEIAPQDSSFEAPTERSGLSPSVNKTISCLGIVKLRRGVQLWARCGKTMGKPCLNDDKMVK